MKKDVEKPKTAKKTLELLGKIGITCDEVLDKDTRKLIFVNEELKLRFFLSKGPDVPTYVEYAVAEDGTTAVFSPGYYIKHLINNVINRKIEDYRIRMSEHLMGEVKKLIATKGE